MGAKQTAKWAGRLLGLGASVFFLAFLVGEGIDGLYGGVDPVFYVFLPMLGIAVMGVGVAWFRADLGGGMTMLGGVLMLGFHMFRGDSLTGFVYGVPFMLVGLLFIVSIQRKKENEGYESR